MIDTRSTVLQGCCGWRVRFHASATDIAEFEDADGGREKIAGSLYATLPFYLKMCLHVVTCKWITPIKLFRCPRFLRLAGYLLASKEKSSVSIPQNDSLSLSESDLCRFPCFPGSSPGLSVCKLSFLWLCWTLVTGARDYTAVKRVPWNLSAEQVNA